MTSTRVRCLSAAALALASAAIPTLAAPWVTFVNETSSRLSAAGSVGATDDREKDYAWGDVDHDGDLDLVVVRKQPFTTPGKSAAVLFMNENGVLTDRTAQYASDSATPGDQGFLTPCNNRDVQLIDVDGDTWVDVVTATTISDGDPKYIGHPRVYRNKKADGLGNWLGFKYEEARIPAMLTKNGVAGKQPRFCSVAAGDLTGDGYPELWFGDYDSSGVGGGSPEGSNADFDDKLLINQGLANPGYFVDATDTRFSGLVPDGINAKFPVSAFGAAGAIVDMNGDGWKDIVKQTSLNDPRYVGMAYNKVSNPGFFETYDVVNQASPYFVSAGDLNNDNKLDLVITDDGSDRYLLNQGNTGGIPTFLSFTFSFKNMQSNLPADKSDDDGFGSASRIVDLDMDGFRDVLIADVDVDITGCGRRLHIYRNLGGAPGSNVTLQEQTEGTNCASFNGNPSSCLVASIPSDKLEGTFDVATMDIDGDTRPDLVIGRCTGTLVYRNVPPIDCQTLVCDDGDACNGVETCNPNSGCISGTPPNCNDSNVCTNDSCDQVLGCQHSNNSLSCSDGNACTTNDICSGGSCQGGPPPNCADTNACTTDSCNTTSGCVHTPLTCNDGNACTTDSCDTSSGCVFTNNTSPCNDGNACTTGDACSGGSCQAGAPLVCNDGNVCTTDSCNTASGCVFTNNSAPCSDNNACTTNDACGGGSCVGGPPPNCNDGNGCTIDSCNPTLGCVNANNTLPCNDGNACTTGDACGGGTCNGGAPLVCSDGNACTDDSCSPATGCTFAPNTAACSDGDACTTNDACSGGSCLGGTALSCDDADSCTVDGCDPGAGCTNVAPAVPGEVQELTLGRLSHESAEVALSWSADAMASSYNVYRGGRADLVDMACFAPGLPQAQTVDDGELPESGEVLFYLVTAESCSGESPLSGPHPNTNPCE